MAHLSEALSNPPVPNAPRGGAQVVVIGAGLTGLVVARSLQQRGYGVRVLEKSLGTGGRLNTRRVNEGRADRGVRYLDGGLPLTAELIPPLQGRGIVKPWPGTGFQYCPSGVMPVEIQDRYCAPGGVSQVAKALAQGVEVSLNHRAIALVPPNPQASPPHWTIHCDHPRSENPSQPLIHPLQDQIEASAVIMAIPAPQAEALLATIPTHRCPMVSTLLAAIAPIRYDPCFSVTATYAAARDLDPPALRNWQGIELPDDMTLAWIAREDRKCPDKIQPIVGFQSSAAFAERWVDAQDLYAIGRQLLARAEQLLNLPFRHPQSFQVHRWRYAQVVNPLTEPYLQDSLTDLWVGGDWCGGNNVEAALASGAAIAQDFDVAHQNSGINPNLGSLVAAPAAIA